MNERQHGSVLVDIARALCQEYLHLLVKVERTFRISTDRMITMCYYIDIRATMLF